MTNFFQNQNNVNTTLAANYTPGQGQFTVATGVGAKFGNPTPTNPIRITCVRATSAAFLAHFKCTGRTGDTLTGVSVFPSGRDATADITFSIGDIIQMRPLAGTFEDIETATNNLEAIFSVATTKGDLLSYNGTGWSRVAAGTDGQVLTADSTQSAGLKYAAISGTGTVTSVGTSGPLTGGPITTSGTITMANSGVTPGSYNSANITVDVYGRVTAATNGSGGSGAPSTSKYIIQQTDPGLSNAQVLASLATGILKSTTTTGVLSIAAAGTDYVSPTGSGAGLTSLNASAIASGTVPVGNLPVMVASGGSHAAGIAPDPGSSAGTTRFLREDATWQVPAGGGGGGDTTATYWISSADATLTNAVNLGLLSTGIVKITVSGSVATPSIDAPTTAISNITPTKGVMLVGNGSTWVSAGTVGANGTALIANSAAAAGVNWTSQIPFNNAWIFGQVAVINQQIGNNGNGGLITFSAANTTHPTVVTCVSGTTNAEVLQVKGSRTGEKLLVCTLFAAATADSLQIQKSDGTVYYAHDSLGRPYTGGTTPTATAGAGAGTGPTITVKSGSTDVNGVITVLTGSAPGASGVVVTLNFSAVYGTAPKVVKLLPAGPNAAALSGNGQVYADEANITTAKFDISVGSNALAATTSYKWYYEVLG